MKNISISFVVLITTFFVMHGADEFRVFEYDNNGVIHYVAVRVSPADARGQRPLQPERIAPPAENTSVPRDSSTGVRKLPANPPKL
jgi:hypothetical protein